MSWQIFYIKRVLKSRINRLLENNVTSTQVLIVARYSKLH
jgi:hypothetical protein